MVDTGSQSPDDRVRLGWWLFVALLAVVVVYVAVSSVGLLVTFRSEGAAFAAVGGVAVGYFLLLDFLPQTFLQPYISGRQLDNIVLLFAYLLGPILLGWYGFFLLPVVFVAAIETARIVLPELLHGERMTTTATVGGSIGADPQAEGPVPTDEPDASGSEPPDEDESEA